MTRCNATYLHFGNERCSKEQGHDGNHESNFLIWPRGEVLE